MALLLAGELINKCSLCKDDWTGASELTSYIALRKKAGLRFQYDKLATVIRDCQTGAKEWDSSHLGPIDAASLLVESQEVRYL